MNTTLKPRTNLILCTAWAVIVVSGLFFIHPFTLLLFITTGVVGAIAGLLQTKCLSESKEQLKLSGSMLDVRKLMMASAYGKFSIWLLWATFIVLLASRWPSFTPLSILTVFCGYASFALARDLVTVPSVIALNRE